MVRPLATRMSDTDDEMVSSVGEGESEMRIRFGPGYRVYFTRRGRSVYLFVAVVIDSGTWSASVMAEHVARRVQKENGALDSL